MPKTQKTKTVYLVDGDIYLHTIAHAAAKDIDWGGIVTRQLNIEEALDTLRSHLAAIEERFERGDIRFILSAPNSFRKALCPSYKSNRKPESKPVGYASFKEKAAAMLSARIVDSLEGDDVIGISATNPNNQHNRIVVTTDKDLKTVPCTIFNPRAETLETLTEDEANHNFYLQTLTGDRTDGYPGCPGVGPVKAERLLKGASSEMEAWAKVVAAFGGDEAAALLQARLARILRWNDYDHKHGEPLLWTPQKR